ncbi:MAG: hypothetical protein IPK13_18770 [Deltaproteobacteria bacterium]|nr:hypothetical protein [Deltaproteobacteria bacterium]
MKYSPRGSRVSRCVFLLIGFWASSGCAALDTFEEVVTDEVVIPADRVSQTPFEPSFGGGFSAIDLSKSPGFKENDVEPGDVDAIFVRRIRVTMSVGANSPASLNRLDGAFESILFYVEANGQDRRTIAQLPIPESESSAGGAVMPATAAADIPADTTLNLKPFVLAPNMRLGTEIVLKADRPALDITLKAEVTLLIDINLLGT